MPAEGETSVYAPGWRFVCRSYRTLTSTLSAFNKEKEKAKPVQYRVIVMYKGTNFSEAKKWRKFGWDCVAKTLRL